MPTNAKRRPSPHPHKKHHVHGRRHRARTRPRSPKKKVKFSRESKAPAPKSSVTSECTTLKKSKSSMSLKQPTARKRMQHQRSYSAWENIVLHYLSKLKNLWRTPSEVSTSTVGQAEEQAAAAAAAAADLKKKVRVMEKKLMKPSLKMPEKVESRASNLTSAPPPSVETVYARTKSSESSVPSLQGDDHKKTYTIVSNAVKYGLQRNVLSKDGKYFWFKKLAGKPTPTPKPKSKKRASTSHGRRRTAASKRFRSGSSYRDLKRARKSSLSRSRTAFDDVDCPYSTDFRSDFFRPPRRSLSLATDKTMDTVCMCKRCRNKPPF